MRPTEGRRREHEPDEGGSPELARGLVVRPEEPGEQIPEGPGEGETSQMPTPFSQAQLFKGPARRTRP